MAYGSKAITSANEWIFSNVLPARAQPYADLILQIGRERNQSPYLIFALVDRESNWGDTLSPQGPGGTGDNGHGHGLAQIDDRTWSAWLAANDWTDPYTNISKGMSILEQNIAFFSGRSSVQGLTNGNTVTIGTKAAAKREVDPGEYPDPRPLSGDALNAAALAAYNTGAGNVLMSLAAGLDPDTTTYGGNYASDVARRIASIASAFDAQA